MHTIYKFVVMFVVTLHFIDISGSSVGLMYPVFSILGSPSHDVYNNVSGTYQIPAAGFQITLPYNWSGIEIGNTLLVSPTGINSRTGVLNPSSNLEKVYLIISFNNYSEIVKNTENRNLSGYHQYVKDRASDIWCNVLSDDFVKLNGMSSEKVVSKCGSNEETSVLSYALASKESIIFVGLKGPREAFEHNYNNFMNSLKSIKIDNNSSLEELITKSYTKN